MRYRMERAKCVYIGGGAQETINIREVTGIGGGDRCRYGDRHWWVTGIGFCEAKTKMRGVASNNPK